MAFSRESRVGAKMEILPESSMSMEAPVSAVMALMFEMNREHGTTLVMVTHDRGIAARCDRQLHIEAGRLQSDSGPLPVAAEASA